MNKVIKTSTFHHKEFPTSNELYMIWRKMYSLYKLNNIIHLPITLLSPLCTVIPHDSYSAYKTKPKLTSSPNALPKPYAIPSSKKSLLASCVSSNPMNKHKHQNSVLSLSLTRKAKKKLYSCPKQSQDIWIKSLLWGLKCRLVHLSLSQINN